ncbi:uncharacterized protein LOC119665570 [Teleopsis dalmanni]|uniref:uncharacterized protein LOC119665570 n=1 Tax=Teleopsis dalmanni TaxID=139649 RepID=UPI0018CD2AE7|nr:uncharacterized protein LOC119665570 [Teleopsis dalmanni]
MNRSSTLTKLYPNINLDLEKSIAPQNKRKKSSVKRDCRKKTEIFWKNCAEKLNASGGSNKTPEQWKKCWADWKLSVKKQATAMKRFCEQTGNPPDSKGLKALEGADKEVLKLISEHAVDGDQNTPEAGIPYQQSADSYEIEFLESEEIIDKNFTSPTPTLQSITAFFTISS